MPVDLDELRALPAAEKLRLIEFLWDGLDGESFAPALPEPVIQEAIRRREEMLRDPACRLSHEEVWRRIRSRG